MEKHVTVGFGDLKARKEEVGWDPGGWILRVVLLQKKKLFLN